MRFLLLCVLAALLFPSLALAHDKGSVQHKNKYLRSIVIQKHGEEAPGCDLVARKCRKWPNPSYKRIRVYFNQLRRLAFPGRYLVVRAIPPSQPPAGAKTVNLSATGLAACIVGAESGGNPGAVNGQYSGIAQWSNEAWHRHGGGQFAASPLGATKQQQLIVLNNGLSRYGCSDWCPYNRC